jgi:tRNA-specific 2-thiouridylase
MNKQQVIYVGLSGGVDSSVSAALLKTQGYKVVGVYMKNWSKDLPGHKCPWAADLADAKRVATKLDIDFKVFDLENDYKQKVVDYMIKEFKKGHTPNPDIMCNQEVKFNIFAQLAFAGGADLIATGHYARTDRKEPTALLRANDENKDQTYFLYRIPQEALEKTLFPIGHLTKPEVKNLAEKYSLHTATKKESMGVCFVGQVGIKDFLKEYIPSEPGDIIDEQTGKIIGRHDGAIFYTIGQRHGLSVGGGLPYYISGKDMGKNTLYVTTNLNSPSLWTNELKLTDVIRRKGSLGLISIARPPQLRRGQSDEPHNDGSEERTRNETNRKEPVQLLVRLRHRAPLVSTTFKDNTLTFSEPVKRPAPGQSAVFYDDKTCLGGGIVT